ncbi:be4df855-ff45-4d87-9ff7-333f2a2ac1b3 [Thermothielavioides terrestris]|uniref:Riboflavin kinase n=1 Tax=Thermothielavioides terrestris TaxID=2587410 RepID=A0A446BL23_9PEZI|nr:be4df855-ff45-4d87-9ff7-333f2a2ac1b3 [Thermothielavioides terrestris]
MATPNRPLIIGDDSGPSPPYPLRMSGLVISGFGRGSKELGIPTANLPVDDALTPWISSVPSGHHHNNHHHQPRNQRLSPPPEQPTPGRSNNPTTFTVFPMVMSIGYNPFYKNTVRSAEVHVLHAFGADFYGVEMRLLICGFVREERDYAGLEALVADIRFDCDVARRSLARPAWAPRGLAVAVEDVPGEEEEGEEGRKKEKVVLTGGRLEAGWLVGEEEGDREGR